MNRAERRAFTKKYGKSPVKFVADKLKPLAEGMKDRFTDGDRVRLNTNQIMARKEYSDLQKEYKEFVEANRDTVFTVRLYRKQEDSFSAMVELVEAPKWLFWYGDLIRVEDGG